MAKRLRAIKTTRAINTITMSLIRRLEWMRDQYAPGVAQYSENTANRLDAKVVEAIKQVKHDRKALRAAIAYIRLSPCDPDHTDAQFEAWKKLKRLMPNVDVH